VSFALRAFLLSALAAVSLAGCQMVAVPQGGGTPESVRPELRPPQPSAQSHALARHYAEVEADLIGRELLRTDGGAEDVPFTTRMLAEDFIRIALYDEYVPRSGQLIARETESRLRRWEQPIRMGLVFGETIPDARRRKDRAEVVEYTRRLSSLTGVPIRLTPAEQANFLVLILNEDERRAFGPELRRLVPGIDTTGVQTVTHVPRSTFCLVLAFSQGQSSTYSRAVALIRGEHPERLRQSCFHEELAQGMGLANDSPAARPSIFNDDEEFALLTPHDELLLRILYDRRLSPGMTADEARPIVYGIAEEVMGGGS